MVTPRQWALGLGLLLAALMAVTPFLDQRAVDNYESLFQRALVTFALARTLNGVISAVQGTEVAIQPAGVGVTLTPGQMLDPVNDLVERFSWVMLGATISLGIQQVLLEVSAWWVLQAWWWCWRCGWCCCTSARASAPSAHPRLAGAGISDCPVSAFCRATDAGGQRSGILAVPRAAF